MDNKSENQDYQFSSKGKIYGDFMKQYNKVVDGQDKAKAQFIDSILGLNADLEQENGPLKIMLLTGPEKQQKREVVKATGVLLFGEQPTIHIDCSKNPGVNPLSFTINLDIQDEQHEQEDISQSTQVPLLHPTLRNQNRATAQEKNSLHKLAKKYEGLSIIHIDNIEYLNENILDDMMYYLTMPFFTLTLNEENYHMHFNNTIVILSYNKDLNEDNQAVGFIKNNLSHKQILNNYFGPKVINDIDDIIYFDYLNETDKNNFINRLKEVLEGDIHKKYNNITINLSHEIIHAFKNDLHDLSGIDTSLIKKKWDKNIKAKIESLMKNTKHMNSDQTSFTIQRDNQDGSYFAK